jgi:hypothetical protein
MPLQAPAGVAGPHAVANGTITGVDIMGLNLGRSNTGPPVARRRSIVPPGGGRGLRAPPGHAPRRRPT